MANYVLVVDLGDVATSGQYVALTDLMYEFGFTLRGRETLRPARFSVICTTGWRDKAHGRGPDQG